MDRLVEIGHGKIQVVFSGKAHPKDQGGKKIIQEIVSKANDISGSIKIIFLPNYNMWLGKLITSGVDLWLNTPLRPNEASGTSGMKATLTVSQIFLYSMDGGKKVAKMESMDGG